MSYNCEILADSLSPQGNRLTTFKITYPRIIHAEMCRHRILSRNTASSRAIPFEKMVQMVEKDPFIPIAWQKDHKGMQGTEYWTDDDTVTVDEGDEYERYTKIYSATEHFITEWLEARDLAIDQSYELNRLGITKQLCNRLLEPFVWTTELVSGTEWENFFELRCPRYYFEPENLYFKSRKDFGSKYHEYFDSDEFVSWTEDQWLGINKSQAEIHIQKIAEMMWDCYNENKPKTLQSGQWHIPYGDNISNDISLYSSNVKGQIKLWGKDLTEEKLKVATARAARISYTTLGDNPKIDYEADIKLHDRLLKSKHLSCFEHCARVMDTIEYYSNVKGIIPTEYDSWGLVNHEYYPLVNGNGNELEYIDKTDRFGWCNNFRGFIQYRHIIENN